VAGLFSRMRSGGGFVNDIDEFAAVPHRADEITQPTLVIASRKDGSVSLAHAEALTAAIPRSRFVESDADSHLIWFGRDWPAISGAIREFLAVSPSSR
jgi:pimeloyl-ACP methyl ester carboxylesterase